MKTMNIITADGLDQELFLLDNPLSEVRVNVEPISSEGIELLKADHKVKYGEGVKLKPWNVPVLCSTTKEVDLNHLEAKITTSYMAQAVRQQLPGAESVLPFTVEGIVETSDYKLILGVRRGFIQNEKISLVPVGYSDANGTRNPFVDQLTQEIEEELAHLDETYKSITVIGYQTDPEFTRGLNVVLRASTSLDSKVIGEMHQDSLNLYQEAHEKILKETGDKSKARKAAKQAVTEKGFTNLNVGDHYPLIMVENEPERLKQIIETKQMEVEGKTYPLMGICQGGLKMQIESLLDAQRYAEDLKGY